MSASGFNDPQMLAFARQLASQFKSSGPKGKGGPRAGSPLFSQGRSQALSTQQSLPSFVEPPPPSMRHYIGLGKFGAHARDSGLPPAIGRAGVDFLLRLDRAEAADSSNEASNTPVPADVVPAAALPSGNVPALLEIADLGTPAGGPVAEHNDNMSNLEPIMELFDFEQLKAEHIPAGTILDTFFSLVSKHNTSDEKTGEADECLIEILDESNTAPAVAQTKSLSNLDLYDLTTDSQSDSPLAAVGAPSLAAAPAAVPEISGDSRISSSATRPGQENKQRLCPLASSFVPSQEMAAPAVAVATAEQSAQNNAPSCMMPSAYLGANRHVCEMPSRPLTAKRPEGGLKTSMWSS